MRDVIIRPLARADQPVVAELLEKLWGSRNVVTRGVLYDAATLPGFLAWDGDTIVGLITVRFEGRECEVVTLDALVQGGRTFWKQR